MHKVSVIVPVYNVASYIEKCAESLFSQTLDDIEYIFVNDATQDDSMNVLASVIERFPNRKEQIRLYNHEHNKGLPQARRTGLLHSSGECIIHCDSDDWVDVDLYERMYLKMKEDDSDLVVCDICAASESGLEKKRGISSLDRNEYVVNMLFYRNTFAVWNKMYRRQIYDAELQYPVCNMGEDMAMTFQLVRRCKRISYVQDFFYYYNVSTPSITRTLSKEAVWNNSLQLISNVDYVLIGLVGIEHPMLSSGVEHMKYVQKQHLMPIINDKAAYRLWKKTFPEINKDVLFDPRLRVPLIDRIKYFATMIGVFPVFKKYFRNNLC